MQLLGPLALARSESGSGGSKQARYQRLLQKQPRLAAQSGENSTVIVIGCAEGNEPQGLSSELLCLRQQPATPAGANNFTEVKPHGWLLNSMEQ